MDQAALLREIMSGIDEKKTIAVCATSHFLHAEKQLKKLTHELSQKKEKKVAIAGIYEFGKPELSDWVLGNHEEYEEKKEEKITIIPGELDFLGELKKNKAAKKKFLTFMRQIENEHEYLFYYCGNGLAAKPINLALFSEKIIVYSDSDQESIEECGYLIAVLKKMNPKTEILVLLGTNMNEREKEQRINMNKWNKYIEGVQFISTSKIENEMDILFQFIKKEGGSRFLADSIEERL